MTNFPRRDGYADHIANLEARLRALEIKSSAANMQMQGGNASGTFPASTVADVTVVFPKPYPAGVFPRVVGTILYDPWTVSIWTVTNTQVTFRIHSPTAVSWGFSFNWLAYVP